MASISVDVAVGLVFAFWAFSLVAAGVTEAISNAFSKRGDDLVRGIRAMLDGNTVHGRWTPAPEGQRTAFQAALTAVPAAGNAGADAAAAALPGGSLTDVVLGHPQLRSLQRVGRWSKNAKPPSYIPSRAFARALLDTLAPADGQPVSLDALRTAAGKLPDAVRKPLLLLISESEDDVEKLRRGVEEWFDDQMARVSGWYKRWAKKLALVIGLGVALALNADTVAMAQTLYREPAVREAVVAQADAACAADPTDGCGDASVEKLEATDLPLGWDCADGESLWHCAQDDDWGAFGLRALGWALTAGAITLGAPFWFDALNRLGSLRNAGGKPGATGRT